jgi:hypothetical protein
MTASNVTLELQHVFLSDRSSGHAQDRRQDQSVGSTCVHIGLDAVESNC